jgi:hypothetical protein
MQPELIKLQRLILLMHQEHEWAPYPPRATLRLQSVVNRPCAFAGFDQKSTLANCPHLRSRARTELLSRGATTCELCNRPLQWFTAFAERVLVTGAIHEY